MDFVDYIFVGLFGNNWGKDLRLDLADPITFWTESCYSNNISGMITTSSPKKSPKS
jgi:hypothetical protein